MITTVTYSTGEVTQEDLTVQEAAIKLKTEDVKSIEFPNDVQNRELENLLAKYLDIGFK